MPIQKDRFPTLLFLIILSQIFAICQPKKLPKKNGGFMFKKVVVLAIVALLCWENNSLGGRLVQCCFQKNEEGIFVPVSAESCSKCPPGCNDLCDEGGLDPIPTCGDECKGLTDWSAPNGVLITKATYQTRCNVTYCEYRCIAGYYGRGKNCMACPGSFLLSGNGEVGTSNVGATLITQCYSVSGKDTSGNFVFSPACFYSE